MSLLGKKKKQNSEDGQMELVEHLAELRSRILRSLCYLVLGMVATYWLFDRLYDILSFPLATVLTKVPGMISITSIQNAFFLRMQVCLISGLIVACPLIVLELWGFIRPALTVEERKPVRFLAPFSALLFFAGVGTGYASLPTAYAWMASYLSDIPYSQLIQDATQYLLLTVKILLAFGICFQLPVVLLFLGRVGVINSKLMTTYWRHAVVIIATLAAIFTPTNDPLTMLMMAVPMAGLYLLSISLVRAFEPRPDGKQTKPIGTLILVALAPAAIIAAVGYWLWRNGPSTLKPMPTPAAQQANTAKLEAAMEQRIKALEATVQEQSEVLKALREQLAKPTPTPSPVPSPAATPTPEPESPTAHPKAPIDNR